MYDHIRGDLVQLGATSVVVEAAGIGYHIEIPLSTYDALRRLDAEATILTHLHVREDDLRLFGFATEDERSLFRLLIGVSGVGPAIAMRMLSERSVTQIRRLVADADATALATIKGIGAKTAQRICIDLKDAVAAAPRAEPTGPFEDAIGALVTLGYKPPEARKAIKKAVKELGEDVDVEELVKAALRG